MIAIALDKLGQITLNCFSSLPILVLRRWNVLGKEKNQKILDFQTSYHELLASTTFEAIGSFNSASYSSKGNHSSQQSIRDFSMPWLPGRGF